MTALELEPGLPGLSIRTFESCIPVLETSRLILRAPRLEDARAVAANANDRRIAEMTANIPYPYTEKDAEQWIKRAWQGHDHPFLILRACDHAPVGATGWLMPERGDPEIGYWIAPAYWGNGYATEAARAVIDHLFSSEGVTAIAARARVVNPASRRVLEKCGFQWTGAGLARSAILPGSIPVDQFRLDRFVWSSIKAWRDASMNRQAPRDVLV